MIEIINVYVEHLVKVKLWLHPTHTMRFYNQYLHSDFWYVSLDISVAYDVDTVSQWQNENEADLIDLR